jgi:hypothetical protein
MNQSTLGGMKQGVEEKTLICFTHHVTKSNTESLQNKRKLFAMGKTRKVFAQFKKNAYGMQSREMNRMAFGVV